ncbi:MAG TPA: polysaccharide biosynthesis C-terminal domain-containing protein [Pyrinomonadaceae bacterium]|nr:polysaccharide biosynthesis C-terminal domain-containing protein [Pyrinomonadaceae bacterium]
MSATKATATNAGAREFVLDTAVVAVAQLLLKLRGLIALPLIVKALGTAEYGVWAQTLALIDFAGSLLGANLYHPLVRFLAEKQADGRTIYGTLLAATVAASALGGAAIWASAEGLSRYLLSDAGYLWHVRAGAVLVLCYNVRLLNLNAYRATGRLKERSLFELVSTFGQLAGVALLLWQGQTLLRVLVFMAAWEAAFAALLTWHVSTIVGWGAPSRRVLSEALRYSLPLMPAVLSISLLDRGDRFVVGYYEGAEGVGVYSANYALAALLMLFQTPLQMTLLPKVAALWATERAAAQRYISLSNKAFLTLAIPYVAAMPLVAPRLLESLGNSKIAGAGGVLTLLVSAGVMMWGVSIMQSQVFYGARRTLPVGIVTGGAAALNLGLNFALVPLMGISGAALATFVSFGAACAALYLLSRDIFGLDFYPAHLLKCAAAAVLMAGVLWALLAGAGAPLIPAAAAGALAYFAALWLLRAFGAEEVSILRGLLRLPART